MCDRNQSQFASPVSASAFGTACAISSYCGRLPFARALTILSNSLRSKLISLRPAAGAWEAFIDKLALSAYLRRFRVRLSAGLRRASGLKRLRRLQQLRLTRLLCGASCNCTM